MNPEDLNRHGFVNNFKANSVECSGCRLIITREALLLCDDINRIHRERSPRCRFVQQYLFQTNHANRTSNAIGFLSQERPEQKAREANCTAGLGELLTQNLQLLSDQRAASPVIPGRDILVGATGGASGSVHIERHPECKFAQQLKEWQSVENDSDEDESTPPLSGSDVGLHRIMVNRSPRPRHNQTESTDSSVDDSSGEQTFWRQIVSFIRISQVTTEKGSLMIS